MRDIWQQQMARMALSLFAGLAMDYLLGLPGVLTVSVLLFWLYTHLHSAWKYHRWLEGDGHLYPPENRGIWADMHDLSIKRLRLHRHRQRQGIRLMREFRHAASALPDAVIILNERNQILWMNQRCESLLGLNPLQDRGVGITNLIRMPAFLQWMSERNEPCITLPAPLNNQLQLTYRSIRYGRNRHMLLARDVTERERVEQTRRDFVANVSHELRTPLTVLSGYLEMMDDPQLSAWQNAIEQMRDQGNRMQGIINDLLTLSRLESESLLEDQKILDIPAMMAALEKEAQVLSQGRHTIETSLQSSQHLLGHESLYQAFSNLVSNAVRYTPEGGRISLVWRTGPDGGEFAVMDTGIGIPRQHISRITERFYRVDSDRSREAGGTGLGLAIVKHILQKHGAHLLVESEAGRGSIFTCSFPAHLLREPESLPMQNPHSSEAP